MSLDQELARVNCELKKNPNDEKAKTTKSSILNNKAVQAASKRNYKEAIELLNSAIEFNPNNSILYSNKSDYYSKLGKINESIECATKAIQIDGNNQTAKDLLAMNLTTQYTNDMEKGRFDEALAKIDMSLELRPNDKILLYNKAANLFNLGRFDEALVCAESSMKIDPKFGNPRSLKAIILNNNALQDTNNKNYEEALKKVNEAIELRPVEVGFYVNKISCLISLNRIPEAKQTLERALQLDAKNKDVISLKAILKNKK